jgi:signal peptidase I
VSHDGSASTADNPQRKLPLWLETIVLLGLAILLAVVVKTLFVQAFYIPSGSMKPGLVINDRIMVQKVSYWGDDGPARGEIVVFEDPGDWLGGAPAGPTNNLSKVLAKIGLFPTGGHLVKRVIGVEGDTVACCDDEGRLEINGEAIDEDGFIAQQKKCDGPMPSGCRKNWEVVVPDDRLFVMGDNRGASADSSARLCGSNARRCDPSDAFVPTDLVVGKVFALIWPIGHFRFIGTPEAFEGVPDPA